MYSLSHCFAWSTTLQEIRTFTEDKLGPQDSSILQSTFKHVQLQAVLLSNERIDHNSAQKYFASFLNVQVLLEPDFRRFCHQLPQFNREREHWTREALQARRRIHPQIWVSTLMQVHNYPVECHNMVLRGHDISLFPGVKSTRTDKGFQAAYGKFPFLKAW